MPEDVGQEDLELLIEKYLGFTTNEVIAFHRKNTEVFVMLAEAGGKRPDDTEIRILSCISPSTLDTKLNRSQEMPYKGTTLKIERVPIYNSMFNPNTICVTNLPPSADVSEIRRLFENKETSAGGPVAKIEYMDNGVFVTFAFKKGMSLLCIQLETHSFILIDALNAYVYFLKRGISLHGHGLTIALLELVPEHWSSHAVVLSNFDPEMCTNEDLLNYLQNIKISKGGVVDDIILSDDGKSLVVCFNESNGRLFVRLLVYLQHAFRSYNICLLLVIFCNK